MSTYFKEIENYISYRHTIKITYNAPKGNILQFNNTRISKLKRKTINCFIQHLESLDLNDNTLIKQLIKEREFRDIYNKLKGIIIPN